MNCTGVRKFLDAYIDGELEAGMMLAAETHLDGCVDCDALVRLQKDMKQALRGHANVCAPEHLRERVKKGAARSSLRRMVMVVTPLAAAAAIFVAVWVVRPGPSEDMAAVVEDVVARHVRELPMEINDPSQQRATDWFQGKIDFPVRPLAPGLKNASFQGARVSNVREHQAAHMVYRVDGRKVTFMVFPSDRTSITGGDVQVVNGRQYLTGRRNGYNVALTREGDMIYAVSSELPANRLVSLLAGRR